jgi:hypothetical protein
LASVALDEGPDEPESDEDDEEPEPESDDDEPESDEPESDDDELAVVVDELGLEPDRASFL